MSRKEMIEVRLWQAIYGLAKRTLDEVATFSLPDLRSLFLWCDEMEAREALLNLVRDGKIRLLDELSDRYHTPIRAQALESPPNEIVKIPREEQMGESAF